ncbi:MarR family winged helix-turn-helix transcriptional regulator [Pseudonocardia sp. CA-107938]|uniref:MarR family winged helix-turn-helix transcriptional regulator n=1 Tax=Pseudonocardia sp. CA-107938 TaxID=3240021 RepID=UPI003D8EA280
MERRDLGDLLASLVRVVVERETPLLEERGLDMWEYVVLLRLAGGAAPTQAQLAAAVRRDKTRLIPILDRLAARGLLERTPDPADRRNRIVALTDEGRALLADCRAAVAAMEDELLGTLRPEDAAALRRALEAVAP